MLRFLKTLTLKHSLCYKLYALFVNESVPVNKSCKMMQIEVMQGKLSFLKLLC